MNNIKNYCLNCNKYGHISKKCTRSIVSYGVICFNINNLNITTKHIEKYLYNKFIDIFDYNYLNISNINLLEKFNNNIKFILIRRKHSLTFIEFVRGKYNIANHESIKSLFSLMSYDENIKIKTKPFEELWNNLWRLTAGKSIYKKEYIIAKAKFEELKQNNFYNMLDDNNLSKYTDPEWGFPKGRKNLYEKNIHCAIREFNEETGLDSFNLLERLNYVEENYIGTDNNDYRHVYYLGTTDTMATLDTINMEQQYEVGDIGWFTYSEIINKLRPYNISKIKLITQLYFFVLNLCIDIGKVNEITINAS